MSIAVRLWLSLVATFVLVVGIGMALRVEGEQALLLETTLRDRRFFAYALEAALSSESSERPEEEARRVLEQPEVAAAHIDTRLVALDGGLFPRPALTSAHDALARHDVAVGVEGDELLTYVPLGQGEHAIAIELAEPKAVTSLFERIGFASLAIQALILATIAAFVAFLLVRSQVGRPLEHLGALARRIGRGELSAREAPLGAREVAELTRAMNHMAEDLEAAHRALDASSLARTQALEQLRHADRLRTVGQLASQLAHELGTPLNVVSGHARLIEQTPNIASDVRESAQSILEQSSKMTKSIRGVLDLSRQKSQRGAIDLVALAETARSTLAPLARKARADVEIERGGPVSTVEASSEELLQVLTNLLVNAFQAMKDGGRVVVGVHERDADPPPGSNASRGRFVVVSVKDEGLGIDAEDIPHVFEPFFTRKPRGEGTGLGLAVVDGIVRDHHGFVVVRSEKGAGTTFEVFLPLRAGDDAEARRQST